jgi:orotidine-5'-phosphate decarboxylase
MLLVAPKTPRDRLIFALDVDDLGAAERWVKLLSPHVGMFKVGPVLYTAAGPAVFDLIHAAGSGVFLDLKLHDIPETVGRAAREAARRRIRLFTVHALGGRKMIERASGELMRLTLVPGLPRPVCLAVTILTSHRPEELREIGIEGSLEEAGERLARLGVEAGAGGVVASPHELPRLVRALPPEVLLVTPGIRGPQDAAGDQARTMGAGEAVEAGASYVVVGRPIRDADDPVGAAEAIVADIAARQPKTR